MFKNGAKQWLLRVAATVVAGFILAVLVRECRDIKQMHDSLIRLESKQK